MPSEDTTDPGRQNPLAFIAVSELDCQARSGAISQQITAVQKTLDTHLVKQQGKAEGIASVFSWLKWLLLVASVLGLLWGGVKFLKSEAASIVKANGYHQPMPTVHYNAGEYPDGDNQ